MGFMGIFGKDKAKEKAAAQSAKLREEALKNARDARDRLGDDTIQKIASKLSEQSLGKKAQRELQGMDKATIADHLKLMLDDK